MNGISERIEDTSNFDVYARIVMPDIRHGKADVLGEASRTIHADAAGMGTQVTPARETVAAPSANYVTFSADKLARKEVRHIRSDCRDFANKLMADHHGNRDSFARPGIPLVNVHVGAADGGAPNPNQNIVNPNLRDGNLSEGQPRLRTALHKGLHRGRNRHELQLLSETEAAVHRDDLSRNEVRARQEEHHSIGDLLTSA